MAIPTIWRTKKQRYSLEGAVCPTCNTTMFPPRKQCMHCSHATAVQLGEAHGEEYNYFMVFDLAHPAEVAVTGDD
jgi:uncharacterized OB-fold protein